MDTPTPKPVKYRPLLEHEMEFNGGWPAGYVERQQLLALDRITEQLTRIADSLDIMISKQA